MKNFVFTKTGIEGVIVVQPKVYGDHRGYFLETYHESAFRAGGIDAVFVQDNQSLSVRGTLRGLHFQKKYPQAKLVRVVSGEVFDVAVDIRPGSPTYGKWHGELLSAENKRQLFIPKGCAHGFLVLSQTAEFVYKCDEFYHPEDEGGLLWSDPAVAIAWPVMDEMDILLSEKDKANPPLLEIAKYAFCMPMEHTYHKVQNCMNRGVE